AILVVVPVVAGREKAAKEAKTAKASIFSAFSAIFAHFALSMLAASVAAEALLFPIGALVFSRITFAGLALNFLAIPLMAVAQIAGMALVPVAMVSRSAAALVGWVAHVGAAGLIWSADRVRFVPAVSYRLAP